MNLDKNFLKTKIHKNNFFEQQEDLVNVLVNIIGLKDIATRDHSIKVAEYGALIAGELNFSENLVNVVKLSGLVHDIGKIAIPDVILNKPTTLTKDEYDLIRKHPHLGAEILGSISCFNCLLPAIKFHHERYDGNGYPGVCKGDQIPVMARIISVADAFDAMTNKRSYRNTLTIKEALLELKAGSGSQFDPTIVNIFTKLVAKRKIRVEI